jgi:hypothetical protein
VLVRPASATVTVLVARWTRGRCRDALRGRSDWLVATRVWSMRASRGAAVRFGSRFSVRDRASVDGVCRVDGVWVTRCGRARRGRDGSGGRRGCRRGSARGDRGRCSAVLTLGSMRRGAAGAAFARRRATSRCDRRPRDARPDRRGGGVPGRPGGTHRRERERRRAPGVAGRRPVPRRDSERPSAQEAKDGDHRRQAGGHRRRRSQLAVGVARHLVDDPSGVHIAPVGSCGAILKPRVRTPTRWRDRVHSREVARCRRRDGGPDRICLQGGPHRRRPLAPPASAPR